MPQIKFTADPKLPADIKHLGYRKGMVVDLPDDQANRWVRRNVAEFTAAGQTVAAAAPAAFDPLSSDIALVRDFLTAQRVKFRANTAHARLREMAAEAMSPAAPDVAVEPEALETA